jgi:alpha-beta hydrolase superfamily lysophospholipase
MKTLLSFTVIAFVLCVSSGNIRSQNFKTESGRSVYESQFTGFDSSFYYTSQGDSLFCRKWGGLNHYGSPKVLLIIHGIGYHSLPFKKIMNYTDTCNVLVYAMDIRGHGFSGKTKGSLESNEQVLTDIDNIINIIKNENPDAPIYLLGTSMGGLYVLGYALIHFADVNLSGLILVGPALKIHKSQIFQISNLEFLWFLLFNQSKTGIHIDDKKLEMSSINQNWIHSRKNDSLALHNVCADYLLEIHKMQKTVKRKSELALISIPVFIQHGKKDKIADIKGSFYLEKYLTNTKAELIVYPHSYHSLFWDNDSNMIFSDIVTWFMENQQ